MKIVGGKIVFGSSYVNVFAMAGILSAIKSIPLSMNQCKTSTFQDLRAFCDTPQEADFNRNQNTKGANRRVISFSFSARKVVD